MDQDERIARRLCEQDQQNPDELVYEPRTGFQREVRAETLSPSDKVPMWRLYLGKARDLQGALDG